MITSSKQIQGQEEKIEYRRQNSELGVAFFVTDGGFCQAAPTLTADTDHWSLPKPPRSTAASA
jgi:hypothetical protein